MVINKFYYLCSQNISIMAINKDTLRTLIKEGQELIKNIKLYDRPFDFEPKGRYVLVGIRQAGKSYMLYKRAKHFLKEKHKIEEIVYIDFDDERLLGMTADDFDLILQAYASVYNYQPLLFFDEIQNISGWEHFARRLANQKYSIFITGSNAKMLSRDIQTTLGGRYFDGRVFPYSFAEYLEAQNVTLDQEWQYGKIKFNIQQYFNEYMVWGGFPELVNYRNKRHWLNDLYEKIILGDVIMRNRIKNEMQLRMTIKRLAENIMQPTSYSRIANLIKAAGFNTTTVSVSDYISFAKDACLIFSLDNYTSKFVEKNTVKKHYFTDNGLLSIFLSGGETALLENLCAIALYRKYGDKLYFYNKNVEVDFFIPEENYAVQVSYSIHDEETRRRETSALIKLNDFLPLNKLLIITFDEEESIPISDNKSIEVIPAWKWLIESERGS